MRHMQATANCGQEIETEEDKEQVIHLPPLLPIWQTSVSINRRAKSTQNNFMWSPFDTQSTSHPPLGTMWRRKREISTACFPSVHHHLTEFACVPLAPSSVQCLHFSCMPIISRPCPSSTTGIDIYCTLLLSSGSSEWLSVCLSVCAEEPLTTLFYKYKSFTGCSCTTYCSAKYGFRFSATLCSRWWWGGGLWGDVHLLMTTEAERECSAVCLFISSVIGQTTTTNYCASSSWRCLHFDQWHIVGWHATTIHSWHRNIKHYLVVHILSSSSVPECNWAV